MPRVFFVLIFFLFLNNLPGAETGVKYSKILLLMGSRFELIAVTEDSNLAHKGIEAAITEIKRIEKLISSWDTESQTSLINKNAGIHPVSVNKELYDLIKRSKKISTLTDGIFDISYASMDKIWKFDGSMKELPESSAVAASVKKINFHDIILDEGKTTVFLKNPGMKIGFGAIGKGYSANMAKKVMTGMGIANGVVNAGGDLICWGVQNDGKPWQIAVTDPKNKHQNLGWLNISDMAVVTSGNYEKFVEFNGHRYSHIINPKTGYPASGIRSVTILCKDAELADALATATFILGKKEGLLLINKLKNIECLIVTDEDELVFSSGLDLFYH